MTSTTVKLFVHVSLDGIRQHARVIPDNKVEAEAAEKECCICNIRLKESLWDNIQQMFHFSPEFLDNLERALSNRSKKLAILLVDMDPFSSFDQKAIVEAISALPMPVFVVGSANRYVDIKGQFSLLPSKGNFHFALAQKSKDSADAVLTIAATKLQDLIVAYDRQEDVGFATISDDRIFETVTHTLRQGGALAITISRQDAAARGLEGISRMLWAERALGQHQYATGRDGSGSFSEWQCEDCGKSFWSGSYSEWECEGCEKSFWSARVLEKHQYATGHWV
jgi:hypothetical protein